MAGRWLVWRAGARWLAGATTLALAGFAQGAAPVADTVLLNGKVYTAEQAQPWADSVAIKDGRFVLVGEREAAQQWIGSGTVVRDLGGATVLPGLIDGHSHPGILSLFASTTLAVAPDSDPESLLDWLGDYAAENPDIPFIVAGFWRTGDFGVQGPDKALLDRVVPHRPLALLDDSGHSMWLNSRALAALGVDANTPDPAPGLAFYQRDEQGEPTGWVKEFATAPVQERVLRPQDTQLFKEHLADFLYYLSSQGVTGLYDGGNLWLHDTVYKALAELDGEGRLPLKYEGTVHVHLPHQIDSAVDELKRLRRRYGSERLRFNTIKIHFDGVHEIRTSAVLDDFADEPGNRGNTLVSQQRLTEFIRELHREKIDLHLHVVGDRATRIALDAYEAAGAQGWDYPRLTLCHLELVDDADIPRFAELGVIANFTPHWFGDLFQGGAQTLGERNNHKMRARSFDDAGATVTFSSDVVVPFERERANPFLGMQTGLTRQEPALGREGPVMAPAHERLSLDQLLQGYTLNGAYQFRQPERVGSIAVGKDADLVILADDLFAMDPYRIADTRVVGTMVDGQFITR
ncbi:amidohydrolase [Parahaliea maris]|uniref:Amidohydrolase n=1 Tax=Parahaliea maris TaxID=2716870 RepID=A0A5C8ZVV1_9GAMM|nr:amidohydrolase [Parahaliea maris]TXS91894.1 amidohydrolase [Parahaliea maris]